MIDQNSRPLPDSDWFAHIAARAAPHVKAGKTPEEAIPLAMAEYTKALEFYSDAFAHLTTRRHPKALAAVKCIVESVYRDVRNQTAVK